MLSCNILSYVMLLCNILYPILMFMFKVLSYLLFSSFEDLSNFNDLVFMHRFQPLIEVIVCTT